MRVLKLLIFFQVFFFLRIFGQDIHFSQFSSLPVFYNPSVAGFINEQFRAGLSYRNQGWTISSPYQTYAASVDAAVQPSFMGDDWFGLAISAFNDDSGDGNLQKTAGYFTMAYHKGMNRWGTLKASLGFSAGLVNRSVDFSALTFGNQWNGTQIDPTLASGERYKQSSFMYLDLSTGVLISYRLNRTSVLFSGISLSHINKPSETFYDGSEALNWKWIIHANGIIGLNDEFSIKPGIYSTFSENLKEVELGTDMLLGNGDLKVCGGLWYRWNRDIIPAAGIDFHGFLMMISYDVTVSSLKNANYKQGGLEISLQKSFIFKTTGKRGCDNLRF